MSEPLVWQPTHVLPEVSSDDRMHELSDRCWCRPLNEFVPVGFHNIWRITHRAAPLGTQADTEDRP